MPTPSNADLMAQAPNLVATAKARGWIRTGPIRPTTAPAPKPVLFADSPELFADTPINPQFPTLAVRVRRQNGTWMARTEQDDRAQCSVGEIFAVIRAALLTYERHAAIRHLPAPDFDAVAAVPTYGVWVTAVRAKEAL